MPAVPSLESLCLDTIAECIHTYEPEALHLPYGGGMRLVDRLARTQRLRPETLGPLLTEWSCSEELEGRFGSALVQAAPGCRGLSALMAHRLNASQQRHTTGRAALPDGTRSASHATTDAALEAR
jgi:hypothetical protein